jgi:hypothetical protein
MRYDAQGREVYPEQELDAEELADYYDRNGIEWRRPKRPVQDPGGGRWA